MALFWILACKLAEQNLNRSPNALQSKWCLWLKLLYFGICTKSSSSSCPAKGAASSKSFENGTKIKVPSNILPPVIFKKSNCNSFSLETWMIWKGRKKNEEMKTKNYSRNFLWSSKICIKYRKHGSYSFLHTFNCLWLLYSGPIF